MLIYGMLSRRGEVLTSGLWSGPEFALGTIRIMMMGCVAGTWFAR